MNYIEQAYRGKYDWWRYTIGFIMAVSGAILFSLPHLIAIFAKGADGSVDMSRLDDQNYLLSLLDPNLNFFFLLLPFFGGLVLLFLAVKYLHGQSFTALTTSRKQIDWKRVFTIFFIWGIFSSSTVLLDYYTNPEHYEFNFQLQPFLILLLVAIVLVPIQTSFEEYLFRGYLMQGIGIGVGNRWVPLLLTSVVFGLLHIMNPEVDKLGYVILVYYIGTGLFLGIMTLLDEGMELALGFHAANNLFTALLVTADWTAFQTYSVLKDTSDPTETTFISVFVPVFVLFPILLFVLSKVYKWNNWKERLFGKIAPPPKDDYNKVHNRFKFNGLHFSHDELKEVCYSLIKEGEPYEQITGDFLIDWLNDKDHLYVKTSGSTGEPKSIKLMKQAMVHSAIATGDFFGLEPGDKAIDCLPSHFIAGKMMLVRAMILGLEIDCIEPSAYPLIDYDKSYQFCAMIPLQLKNTIKYINKIDTIIVGGSKVTSPLKHLIEEKPGRYYETYGMTETITHVAVRQLKSLEYQGEKAFKAMPNVSFSQDDRHCLTIEAPNLIDEPLITNDIVTLDSPTTFLWKGRYDNVVNSAGVKLFPEQIEDKLQTHIKARYIVGGIEDAELGEKLVLLIEGDAFNTEGLIESLKKDKRLNKFEIPKEIKFTSSFSETINGKVQRQHTLKKVFKN